MRTNTHPIIALLLSLLLLNTNLSAKKIDPIRFTITTDATHLSANEEFEIKITAKYHSVNPNLVYVFDGANAFKLKLIMPDGFKQTGGTYSDFVGAELTSTRPYVTYTIKGKFVSDAQSGIFQLLRSHKNAGSQSEFVQVGVLAFSTIQLSDVPDAKTKRLAVVTPVGYVPYLSINQLRSGNADSARAVYITDAGRFGLFRWDPADTSTPDDSAMVLVSSTKRFKRITDYVTPEMFGAKGDGVADERKAIQSALNSNYRTVLLSGLYKVSGSLSVPSNKRIIGQNSTITAANETFFTGLEIKGRQNVYVEGLTISAKEGENAFDYAIHIMDSKNVEINKCIITNIGKESSTNENGFGIFLDASIKAAPSGNYGCENIRIVNNTIKNIKGNGMVRGDFVLITNSDKVIIENNYFDTCRRQGIAISDFASNIKISNNFIFNTYLAGIDIEPDSPNSVTGFISITKNTIKNFGSKPDSTIGVQFYGIDCHLNQSNIDIEGNHITTNSAISLAGINCQNGSSQIKITNNTIEGNNVLPYGMFLYSGSGARDLIISNNTITGFKTTGINGYKNGLLTIIGNRLESSLASSGIYINETETIISDNIVVLNTETGDIHGIRVLQNDFKRITGNVVKIKKGTAYSLYVSGGYSSAGTSFSNNSAINMGSATTAYLIDLSATVGTIPGFSFTKNYWDPTFTNGTSPAIYSIKSEIGTGAPTTGYHVQGSTVSNSGASSGGYAGWICVTSGTPGTWKAFGAIVP